MTAASDTITGVNIFSHNSNFRTTNVCQRQCITLQYDSEQQKNRLHRTLGQTSH